MTDPKGIRLLNRYPHTEAGFCPRCREWYTLTQLRLPPPQVGDGISLSSMAHPDGLIDKMADAIRSGKLKL